MRVYSTAGSLTATALIGWMDEWIYAPQDAEGEGVLDSAAAATDAANPHALLAAVAVEVATASLELRGGSSSSSSSMAGSAAGAGLAIAPPPPVLLVAAMKVSAVPPSCRCPPQPRPPHVSISHAHAHTRPLIRVLLPTCARSLARTRVLLLVCAQGVSAGVQQYPRTHSLNLQVQETCVDAPGRGELLRAMPMSAQHAAHDGGHVHAAAAAAHTNPPASLLLDVTLAPQVRTYARSRARASARASA